jgi:hypothetical protein
MQESVPESRIQIRYGPQISSRHKIEFFSIINPPRKLRTIKELLLAIILYDERYITNARTLSNNSETRLHASFINNENSNLEVLYNFWIHREYFLLSSHHGVIIQSKWFMNNPVTVSVYGIENDETYSRMYNDIVNIVGFNVEIDYVDKSESYEEQCPICYNNYNTKEFKIRMCKKCQNHLCQLCAISENCPFCQKPIEVLPGLVYERTFKKIIKKPSIDDYTLFNHRLDELKNYCLICDGSKQTHRDCISTVINNFLYDDI